MLWTKIVLALAGFALCFAEMLIPGFGIFGIAGVLCLTASVIMVGMEFGIGAFFAMTAGIIVLFAITIFFLKKSGLSGRVILQDRQNAEALAEDFSDLEGKCGIAETTLRPFGTAEIEGKRYDVCSIDGFIEPGQSVRVVQVKNSRIEVRLKK